MWKLDEIYQVSNLVPRLARKIYLTPTSHSCEPNMKVYTAYHDPYDHEVYFSLAQTYGNKVSDNAFTRPRTLHQGN